LIKVMKEPIQTVEFTPFGGVMTYRAGHSSSKGTKGLLLALAGPAANYLVVLVVSFEPVAAILGSEFCRLLIVSNLSMMLINLLPVLPLDGGNALFSIGYYLFDVAALVSVLSFAGIVCGLGCVALGIYGILRMESVNVSLFMIGGYLTFCAIRSKEALLIENMYTVVQERLVEANSITRLCTYRVPACTRLYQLIKPIASEPAVLFLVEEADGHFSAITSRSVCKALLDTPGATLKESVMQKSNF